MLSFIWITLLPPNGELGITPKGAGAVHGVGRIHASVLPGFGQQPDCKQEPLTPEFCPHETCHPIKLVPIVPTVVVDVDDGDDSKSSLTQGAAFILEVDGPLAFAPGGIGLPV